MDIQAMERKWQQRWDKEKVFEPEIDTKKKKYFLTFPYPYVNFSPHIGHFYTIMRVEAFSRYKRSQGYNVLFPQAWHCTGTPIVSSANRVKEREPRILENLKSEGFTKEDLKKFENPQHWIDVFGKSWHDALKNLGFGIDWRRNFITTDLNPHYDKFVRWQFRKLKEKKLIEKGRHPVVWCPKDNIPVGDHDRSKGEGETPKDFIWIKFKLKDSDLILLAGTTRPDALLGQTHLWIDPDATYKIVEVGGEKWVVGEEAVKKIADQYVKPKEIGEIKSSELMGKWAQGPLVDYPLYIVPAWFIDANVGSGIVYSALEDPVDLIEVQNIQNNLEEVKKHGLDVEVIAKLKPISIIDVPGLGDDLGQEMIDKYKITSPKEKKKVKESKDELNKLVFRKGTMKKNCGKYAGLSVEKAQEKIKHDLIKNKDAVMFYELTDKVVCRCFTECIVKIVKDQWFINYNDAHWKKKAHGALKNMTIYPDAAREQFEYVIDWLNEWACTREIGLGTKLPFDEKWLIESLSDSTIYMAYYTIAHLIKNVPAEKINDEFFDYIFLGEGKKPTVEGVDQLRKEFEYWYPLDFRNSGKDLVQNHLTFCIFNHAAIFPPKYWPKAIAANGWVRVDGEKMSKSLGNMIPLHEMVQKFGADAARLTMLNGGESLNDPNWDTNFAENLGKRFVQLLDIIQEHGRGRNAKAEIDNWMKNKLAKHVTEATKHMEKTLFRSAIQVIFFELVNDIKWYLKRTEQPNKEILNEVIETFIIMAQPFTPHLAEEMWEKIGKKNLVSVEKWPKYKEMEYIDGEELIKKLMDDVHYITKIMKKKSSKAFVYVIPKELDMYKDASSFLSKELNTKLTVYAVNDSKKHDPEGKASKAKPGKPAIYLE